MLDPTNPTDVSEWATRVQETLLQIRDDINRTVAQNSATLQRLDEYHSQAQRAATVPTENPKLADSLRDSLDIVATSFGDFLATDLPAILARLEAVETDLALHLRRDHDDLTTELCRLDARLSSFQVRSQTWLQEIDARNRQPDPKHPTPHTPPTAPSDGMLRIPTRDADDHNVDPK